MTFILFWIDIYPKEKLFGFGILSIGDRSLIGIFSDDIGTLIDILWFQIYKR